MHSDIQQQGNHADNIAFKHPFASLNRLKNTYTDHSLAYRCEYKNQELSRTDLTR
jgi:hypothetical protein